MSRRSDPSAAAGRSAAARCGYHPVRQGQPGRAGGQERPPHCGDAHRRRLCGGRDDAPADEAKALKAQLIRLADGRQVNLILTTGGTGFSPRDITPEATYAVADRNAPGIAEAMRYHSLSITPRGMLSRAASVLRGKTLIVNLPGSPKAVKENLEYILPSLGHGVRIAAGLDGECARK